jgi:6-phosphogluconate dehydrogenase
MENKVIIITGVSGSGKTTVGQRLAEKLSVPFYDGDAFHPPANVAKMSSGIPLEDQDREPWLGNINQLIRDKSATETVIIGCSALKERYRKILSAGIDPSMLKWVHLQGDYDLIHQRMSERPGHFMSAAMLASQFEAYEPPRGGLMIEVQQSIEKIIDRIMSSIEKGYSDVGLVGLGVMGTSLARNIARSGFSISIFNRHIAGKEEGIAGKMAALYPELNRSQPFDDLQAFVASLKTPRKVVLMVNAGSAVDDVVAQLKPLLEHGDVIVDGGNSHFRDTASRQRSLAADGIHFVGTGVSGGEEGALLGPSIMPGGSLEGYQLIKDILQAIAARNESGEVCCDYIGEGGAGHFVKMVHNGIEYAEMQLIAEIYSHLRNDQLKTPDAIADIFERWDRVEAGSYLLGITADILRFKDIDGSSLIDNIADVAGNKGTGGWTTMAACEMGVPVPAMTEALFSRYLSSFKEDRTGYSQLYSSRHHTLIIEETSLLHTYMFCRIMNHHQGMKLIGEASDNFGWGINTAVLLRIWSAGCIIRSTLLATLREGWDFAGADAMKHPYVKDLINGHIAGIKDTVSKLALSAQAYPVTSSCLEYYKGMISSRTNANIIQAQRDYFGAHTYQRTDDASGMPHHTKWF